MGWSGDGASGEFSALFLRIRCGFGLLDVVRTLCAVVMGLRGTSSAHFLVYVLRHVENRYNMSAFFCKPPSGVRMPHPHDNQVIHFSDLLWMTSEIAFATTRSAWTDGCSSSNLRQHAPAQPSRRPHLKHAPQGAIPDVRTRRLRTRARVPCALVELKHARVHRARGVERRGPVREQLRLIEHLVKSE